MDCVQEAEQSLDSNCLSLWFCCSYRILDVFHSISTNRSVRQANFKTFLKGASLTILTINLSLLPPPSVGNTGKLHMFDQESLDCSMGSWEENRKGKSQRKYLTFQSYLLMNNGLGIRQFETTTEWKSVRY